MIKLEVKNLSVHYPIKSINQYLFRARLIQKIKNFFYKKNEVSDIYIKKILALKNIQFNLIEGDRLGLIGLNGSGKSTLLKCLANILPKTDGTVDMGDNEFLPIIQPQAMCEPDDTIENNLILLGYYLGYPKKQILENLEKILTFADLLKYRSLPLNTLSTGMKFRLVFSFCFLIDKKKIFFIDEFLTTGDEKFQNKGFDYINNNFSKNIIVLCSHSRRVIEKFCNKVLILQSGSQVYFGPAKEGLENYQKLINT